MLRRPPKATSTDTRVPYTTLFQVGPLRPVARLDRDAGREGERVAQADDRLVGIVPMRHDIDAACGLCGAFFGFAGELRRGDDDRRVGLVGIGGGGGEA